MYLCKGSLYSCMSSIVCHTFCRFCSLPSAAGLLCWIRGYPQDLYCVSFYSQACPLGLGAVEMSSLSSKSIMADNKAASFAMKLTKLFLFFPQEPMVVSHLENTCIPGSALHISSSCLLHIVQPSMYFHHFLVAYLIIISGMSVSC